MKANEAPEKLYLHPTAKGKVGASWLAFPLTNEDIEYTRTDAFIEKACAWLEKHATSYIITTKIHGCNMTGLHVSLNEDFRKAMEEAIKL